MKASYITTQTELEDLKNEKNAIIDRAASSLARWMIAKSNESVKVASLTDNITGLLSGYTTEEKLQILTLATAKMMVQI